MSDEQLRQKKYETFGHFADAGLSFTEQNGRYPAQAAGERLIFADIYQKLRLSPGDRMLDVGCGVGNTLIPASFVAAEVVGIDHPKVIDALKKNFSKANCELIDGNFLSIDFKQKFSKILIYNVFSALPDKETAYGFVDRALSILKPCGLLLIGDIPNADRKKRFQASARGQAFAREWDRRMTAMPPADITVGPDHSLPALACDDAFVMDLCMRIRSKGFDASVLSQPQALPFGNTREDILVSGPEYDDRSMAFLDKDTGQK